VGINKNVTLALHWYKISADLGHYDSMANFANLVVNEKLEDKYQDSFRMLKKCITNGWELCMWSISKFFNVLEVDKVLQGVSLTFQMFTLHLTQ
jgi:TPR repeat protein